MPVTAPNEVPINCRCVRIAYLSSLHRAVAVLDPPPADCPVTSHGAVPRYAPGVTPEVKRLLETLDAHRAGVLRKVAGLSDADARRSPVPSGTNLAGLLQHLTFVESLWFEEIVAGGRARRGKRSMEVDGSVALRTLRHEYRTACDASNEIITALGNGDVPVTGTGKTRDLRSAMLAVIGEAARHAGHADIIRELLDGRTGR